MKHQVGHKINGQPYISNSLTSHNISDALRPLVEEIVENYIQSHPEQIQCQCNCGYSNRDSRYMTRMQVAEFFNVARVTVDRWARAGKITKVYPFGNNTVRFLRDEIELPGSTIEKYKRL